MALNKHQVSGEKKSFKNEKRAEVRVSLERKLRELSAKMLGFDKRNKSVAL